MSLGMVNPEAAKSNSSRYTGRSVGRNQPQAATAAKATIIVEVTRVARRVRVGTRERTVPVVEAVPTVVAPDS